MDAGPDDACRSGLKQARSQLLTRRVRVGVQACPREFVVDAQVREVVTSDVADKVLVLTQVVEDVDLSEGERLVMGDLGQACLDFGPGVPGPSGGVVEPCASRAWSCS